MIKISNLPTPSDELIALCRQIASEAPLELNLKKIHDTIQTFTVNSVSRKFIEDNEQLNFLVNKEFKGYFDHTMYPALGIVKNIGDDIACWPPHSDRTRIFALNYYIEEGGTNVQTVMYNTIDNYNSGKGTGNIFPYKGLILDKVYHLDMNQWYIFNVRQVHSIENVMSTRLILTLSFHDINYFDFLEIYPEYIGDHVSPSQENFDQIKNKL